MGFISTSNRPEYLVIVPVSPPVFFDNLSGRLDRSLGVENALSRAA
jgi:hypothetical protein